MERGRHEADDGAWVVHRLLAIACVAALSAAGCTSSRGPSETAPIVPPPPATVSPPPDATVEPTTYEVPTSPATVVLDEPPREPYASGLARGDRPLAWKLVRLYDGGQTLAVRYSAALGPDAARVQLQDSNDHVRVQIVTNQRPTDTTAAIFYTRRITLSAPLGDRQLLHAPSRCCPS